MTSEIVNYYEGLEVQEEADETVIKKAYRKLVLKWHPDKHPEDRNQAEDKIRLINAAYEILSNPTKRETYDIQRRAVRQKQAGFVPTAPMNISPRMTIPKEFLVQPIGFPERFFRYAGHRLACHNRKEAVTDFQSFFQEAKFSLWWLPEINNMCRIRALGSRARGDEMGAVAGVAGGLNLAVDLIEGVSESEITLLEAKKGQRNERVNFITVASPVYEGAFRFEVAYHRGFYLAFLPPTHLRVIPYNGEDRSRVIDFSFVDFSVMFKFIDIEEVLLPSVAQHGGSWLTLRELQKDPNVRLYFQNILGRPVWDLDDFQTYFEGHWSVWEYRAKDQSVRIRPPSEKLGQLLKSARTRDDVASAIAGAGAELEQLSMAAAARALQVLADPAKDSDGTDITAAVNRVTAQKKMLAAMKGIVTIASQGGQTDLSLRQLLTVIDQVSVLCGDQSGSVAIQRADAIEFICDVIVGQIELGTLVAPAFEVTFEDLLRLLRIPYMSGREHALKLVCEPLLAVADSAPLMMMLRDAAAAGCRGVADQVAAVLLGQLPGMSLSEAVQLLQEVAVAGAQLENVAMRTRAICSSIDVPELAVLVIALGERGTTSEDLAVVADCLSTKAPFGTLRPDILLQLAVSATKSASLGPAVSEAVARAAAASIRFWAVGDIIRLLLATVKCKGGSVLPGAMEFLLSQAGAVVIPQLRSLANTDLVKLVLAVGSFGASDLLEASAKEVDCRLDSFMPAQRLLVTQALGSKLPRAIADDETRRSDSDGSNTSRGRERQRSRSRGSRRTRSRSRGGRRRSRTRSKSRAYRR